MFLLRPKIIFKLLWFAFGFFGLYIIFRQYFPDFWPKVTNSEVVKGVQSELVKTISQTQDSSVAVDGQLDLTDLQQLDPQQASEIITKVLSQKITEIIRETTVEIKEFPAKQVKKIKIGACEELLEEDICSVASQLECKLDPSE